MRVGGLYEKWSSLFKRKTRKLAWECWHVVHDMQPVTVRQVYYQIVSRGMLPNVSETYRKVEYVLVQLRENNLLPYEFIVDRGRSPHFVNTWDNLGAYLDTISVAYKKNLWMSQDDHVEIWLEKDALVGVIEPVTNEYLVGLYPTRGYPSLSFIYQAAETLRRVQENDKIVYIYYVGDFDPSCMGIEAFIKNTLEDHGITFNFTRIAILPEDIERYDLPPLLAKVQDPNFKAFSAQYGTQAVELDALPPEVLRQRVKESILNHISVREWNDIQQTQTLENESLNEVLVKIDKR